jgi:hypothetical protein
MVSWQSNNVRNLAADFRPRHVDIANKLGTGMLYSCEVCVLWFSSICLVGW